MPTSLTRRWWMLALVSTVAACDSPNLASPPVASALHGSNAVTPNAPSKAGLLEFSVSDPRGDNTGPIDVRSMNFVFDNTSGAFSVTLQAYPSGPFATGGSIHININLYNPAKSSFFHCNPVDFALDAATRTLVLTGTSSEVTTWASGDLIYPVSAPGTPLPPNVSEYQSAVVWNFDITMPNRFVDAIANSDPSVPAKIVRSRSGSVASQGLACL